MSSVRLVGIETEYGLMVEGGSPASQIEDAAKFVAACPYPCFVGWDYSCESPRRDLRGFDADKLHVDPEDARWDEGQPRRAEAELRADRVLTNGARFYNDHGHPEYATPECARLLDLVAADRAGEQILLATAKAFEAETGKRVKLYKNNTDFHGASYGTHENYLVPRSVSFESLFAGLLPLMVCRQLLTGAGKVGSEVGRPAKFQLSQRADFFTEAASVDTLYRRPIFNTRDEPHADPAQWQRLHVISGDANRMEWATAMKCGMLRVALALIEIGEAPIWKLCSAVKGFESISKDERMEWKLELQAGSWTSATEVLDSYASAGEKLLLGQGAETDWVLSEWRLAIEDLRRDPISLSDRVDWAAKLKLLNEFADAEGSWNPQTMQSLDLAYHDLDEEEGLFSVLQVRRLVDDGRVKDAVSIPPNDTRAKARGDAVLSGGLTNANWRRLSIGSRQVELQAE